MTPNNIHSTNVFFNADIILSRFVLQYKTEIKLEEQNNHRACLDLSSCRKQTVQKLHRTRHEVTKNTYDLLPLHDVT